MVAMSDYLEGALITGIFRTGSAFAKPTHIYIALATVTITDSMTGSTITEPSGNSYARTQCDPADANWANVSAGNGTTSNVSAITFPTATGSWGTITDVALVDASTVGNLLFYGALTSSKTVGNNDVFQFAASSLSIQIDN